ncbi:hypothetical protein D0T57_04820 [Dysgonomonas sp. 511]|nr:hypothetical protein [Dysgonomonas sp. 511]
MTKGKSVFIVDLILIPIFILVTYSGLKLHIAGDVGNHDIWSSWAHFHIIVSIISLIAGWLHIKAHWGWYKGLLKKGLAKKSKVTVALSILFLALVITGIILVLFADGGNSATGLWHYRLGLIMVILLIVHFVTRFSLLKKGLTRKKIIVGDKN